MNITEVYINLLRTIEPRPYSVTAEATFTRGNGSTFQVIQRFVEREFDQIPWHDHTKIIEAHWYPAGDPNLPENRWSSSEFYLRAFVREEVLFIETNGWVTAITYGNNRDTSANEIISVDTGQEVVDKIQEIIGDLFIDYSRSGDAEDYDESRYDPLDERNYPLHER